MHSDVKQEGLYQNCKFGDPRGRDSDPRAGQTWYIVFICKNLKNIFFNAVVIDLKLNEYLE